MRLKNSQREFESLRALPDAKLPHVPATYYLHSKLERGPRPTPTFGPEGFRALRESTQQERQVEVDEPAEASRLIRVLESDDETGRIIREMERLHRVVAELQVAKELIAKATAMLRLSC